MAVQLPRSVYLAIGAVLTHPRFHPLHRRLYRATGGRGPVGRALGVDMILLGVTGRRSGVRRSVPLAAVPDGDDWVVVASNGGRDRLPGWALDLRADGRATVEHRLRRTSVVAHEAEGAAIERLWRVVADAYPGFVVYRDVAPRDVPLFVLRPVETA